MFCQAMQITTAVTTIKHQDKYGITIQANSKASAFLFNDLFEFLTLKDLFDDFYLILLIL